MPAPREPVPSLPTGLRAALPVGFWREARAPAEVAALRASDVWRRGAPAGDGQPVVLVPGFLAGGASMGLVRTWLARSDYRVTTAPVGRNATSSASGAAAVARALAEAREASGRPVVLVGHSRGGQQARVVAGREPEHVALLVTMGSPVRRHLPPNLMVRMPIEALRVASRFGLVRSAPAGDEQAYERDLFAPFPGQVPWVSIWSRRDGVVDWQSCVHEQARSVEVRTSHVAMVGSAEVFVTLAGILEEAPWRGEGGALV